jgi:hypothetical protein
MRILYHLLKRFLCLLQTSFVAFKIVGGLCIYLTLRFSKMHYKVMDGPLMHASLKLTL